MDVFADLLGQDPSFSWSYLEFSNPIQKLKEVKDQIPNAEDIPNMFHSAEEGEYPNVAPYATNSNDERQPLLSKQRATQVTSTLGSKLKTVWDKVSDYLNPPMMGGGIAVILGLIPFMRHALFDNAGYLSPIAESIKNLGKLYTVLQMFVLGAHLYSKQGGKPAFWPMLYLFAIRFVAMTALGCGAVYGMRQWLGSAVREDPVLVSLFPLSCLPGLHVPLGLHLDPHSRWTPGAHPSGRESNSLIHFSRFTFVIADRRDVGCGRGNPISSRQNHPHLLHHHPTYLSIRFSGFDHRQASLLDVVHQARTCLAIDAKNRYSVKVI